MILAQGLYSGPKTTKSLILAMASYHMFPNQDIAHVMSELQPSVQIAEVTPMTTSNMHIADSMCFPIMSVAQVERLEEVINKLKVLIINVIYSQTSL